MGITLYYGGACIGVMDAAAQGAMKHDGKVIGISPDFFTENVIREEIITEMVWVKSMSERKQLMERCADAFVALPGGFGTMDELFELLTDAQLGLHNKPVAVLNNFGFYDGIIAQIEHFVNEGFVTPEHAKLLIVANTIDELFQKLANWDNPIDEEWLKRIKH